MSDYLSRMVDDGTDRPRWLKAREVGLGASDVAKFARVDSWPLYLKAKLARPFDGNSFTQHGNQREPRMLEAYHFPQNVALFHAAGNRRHLATPDGILVAADGSLILAECKTTSKPFGTIPINYYRQVWWAQYVLGADRTLVIWEEHHDFRPVQMEPESVWIDRDDNEIAKLVTIADLVLEGLDRAKAAVAEFEEDTKWETN